MREYIDYRKKENLDGLLWESFPEKAELMAAPYRGFDKEGHPLYIDQPDPALLTQLLTEFPRELLLRVHLRAMAVSYTHLRAHETPEHLVCRLLLEKKKTTDANNKTL
eukprot:TRINITY_DN56685_c0_g1_i1.p1 TRINITY_DN56685_c0_g1~~TRINITY_DN56685_c0_g1_i1.p1  ORF type:complete len:108 (-),score=30.80 TRINITY_DN56685_c0_g1_i1:56-379(-)